MNRGFLSQYFEGIAFKRLSAVEVNIDRSNQREFNGSKPLKDLLGSSPMYDYPVTFVWLGDENEGFTEESSVTWYDARAKKTNRSAEWRLYFKNNPVSDSAQEGDLLIVARRPNQEMYIIIVKADTTFENQLLWLFGVNKDVNFNFTFQSIEKENDPKIDFAFRYILEELGIEIQEPDNVILDAILEPYFSKGFPKTREFSALARGNNLDVCPVSDPDLAIIKWMEQEEKLFKRLERIFVKDKLDKGFQETKNLDVNGFSDFSLSVRNRRKSRIGYALENHMEEIFRCNNIKNSRGETIEGMSKPDFLFPNVACYVDQDFPTEYLTMLGVKSTSKNHWRQVLTESMKIENKHLFTLEPGISENQTSEMKSKDLQLVLPQNLHQTYSDTQQNWLLNLTTFIDLVKERQDAYFK